MREEGSFRRPRDAMRPKAAAKKAEGLQSSWSDQLLLMEARSDQRGWSWRLVQAARLRLLHPLLPPPVDSVAVIPAGGLN